MIGDLCSSVTAHFGGLEIMGKLQLPLPAFELLNTCCSNGFGFTFLGVPIPPTPRTWLPPAVMASERILVVVVHSVS